MSSFERALEHLQGKELSRALKQGHVTIFGAGGLGSNLAMLLTRAGIGQLTIIDYDKVEESNLNRQFYFDHQVGQPKVKALEVNLLQINPEIILHKHPIKVDEDNLHTLLPSEGIIVEAFDKADQKAMLINKALKREGLIVVSGSGMAGIDDSNKIRTKRIAQNFFLVGDDQPIPDEGCKLVGARVMIVAAHQANLVIRLLSDANK